jgi:phytoene dehydrogenase-like protein
VKLLLRELRSRGARGLADYFGRSAASCRAWLEVSFRSEVSRALIAPWVLHVGLSPESAMSSLMAKVILMTLERAGAPVVVGGGENLVNAFAKLIHERGGELHVSAEVTQILLKGARACGVRTADGREFLARRAVVCNVTPAQLYQRLLPAEELSRDLLERVRARRPGRADMQIHLALDRRPDWLVPELADVAMLHVTEGLDAVSASVNEAQRGLLPARGTIVVAQPAALDPTRAPDGKSVLWIQLQELPGRILGDALGEIPAPLDGLWTPDVRELYADRIIARLERLIPNLRANILGRKVLSPADLEALNINLEGGIRIPVPAISTSSFCGAPLRDRAITPRPSRGCITSALRHIPVRDWVECPAFWPRRPSVDSAYAGTRGGPRSPKPSYLGKLIQEHAACEIFTAGSAFRPVRFWD